MSFAGIFSTLLILGAVQGIIVSALLYYATPQPRTDRLLAVLIFLLSLACLNLYLPYTSWVQEDGLVQFFLQMTPLPIVMPVGPLLYFYFRSSLDPHFRLEKKHRPHFYPLIIDLAPSLTTFIFIGGVLLDWFDYNPGPWGNFIDNYNVYSDIPRWCSITVYLWLGARCFSQRQAQPAFTAGGQQAKWLRQLIRAFALFQLIWLFHLVPYVIPRYTDIVLQQVDWYPVYVPLVVLIYWLGIRGYMMAARFERFNKKAAAAAAPLPQATVQETAALLKKAMETDKLYLDPNLNLSLLSQHTGIAQKTISAVLNQHLHKSFNEFVNEYRITVFKQKLLEPEAGQLTIFALALDSGFNSQATFQRAFKQSTGMSPREYMQLQVKKTG